MNKEFLTWYNNEHWGNEDFKTGCELAWEAALELKSTKCEEQPAQEPCTHRIADARNQYVKSGYFCLDCGMLFSAADHFDPPQRPWVGLTEDEAESVCKVGAVYAPDGVITRKPLEYRKELERVALIAVRKAAAKLKEKNT